MDLDIPDTSSDSSEDTLIVPDEEPKVDSNNELDNLFKKYLGDTYSTESDNLLDEIAITDNQQYTDNVSNISSDGINNEQQFKDTKLYDKEIFSLSDEDSDLPSFSQVKRCKQDFGKLPNIVSTNSLGSCSSKQSIPSFEDEDSHPVGKRKLKTLTEKENLRLEKERKKEEEKRNKALKESLARHYKNMKPEHCLKFVKTHIDEEIIGKEYFVEIINQLKTNEVGFSIESQLIPLTISWTRKIDNHVLDLDGKVIDTSEGIKIEEVLLIMGYNKFINLVHEKAFLSHMESVCTKLEGSKLILAIFGLQNYYRFQKNKKNQEFKEAMSNRNYKSIKDEKKFEGLPVVSRRTVEYALTEIQLIYSISHRMIETSSELGMLVFQLTKSIAQLPYKLEQQEKFIQSKWFMSEDNKNCIRVDKNGNGLSRLWKQMITTFPLASLETAEAIASVYPTPLSLFQAYKNSQSTTEGEKLLQDIPIRRNAGPISTMRKVGPELSRKLYHFITSTDPDKIL